jgi:hypothetical protein
VQVAFVGELVDDRVLRPHAAAEQILDTSGVSPGNKRIEVLALTAQFFIKAVVARRTQSDDRESARQVRSDLSGKDPDPAIGQALAVADAERAQGSGHVRIQIASGADEWPKVVAFTGFIGANVRDEFIGIGGRRARAGRGQPSEVTWHGPDGSAGHRHLAG